MRAPSGTGTGCSPMAGGCWASPPLVPILPRPPPALTPRYRPPRRLGRRRAARRVGSMSGAQPLAPAGWLARLGGGAGALRPALPALLFGLRLWASVCLALYVAFWLELDTPSWAG